MKKLALPLIAALLATGCANHVRQDVLVSETINRDLVSEVVSVTPLQGTISPQGSVESSTVALRLDAIKQEKVVHETTTQVVDFVTPYSPLRELYEFPVGIGAIATGVVVNVLDFALLGLLPNSLTDKPLDVGFAGINPFMNIESRTRVEQKLVSEETAITDEKVEVTTLPLVGERVSFAFGDSSVTAETGQDGVATAFIGPVLSAASASLMMTVEGREEANRELYVPRRIRQQAAEAHAILGRYAGGLENVDSESVEQDLARLEELGYHEYVRKIERELMAAANAL